MLFNSPEFIFLFLPAAVLLHFALARWRIEAAVVGTTLSSLAFYAWWNPPFVLLPIASIIANFLLLRRMLAADQTVSRRLMIAGIVGNVLVLGYFKYSDFLLSIVYFYKAAPPNVPLALSFTTFVQIAFLVYAYQRRPQFDFKRYALFVAFFPHLIAGPIVRWTNLGRQLSDTERFRPDWNNVALGLTIFTIGLAKKILIADALSPHVALVFDAAARGEPVTAAAAWGGGFAFIAQIYFDFSGYSDMAIGLGLLFNFRLPVNFAAPLRATNMFDLWRRWHITLSRLARDLVYVPLAAGDTGPVWRAFALVLTMLVIGVWHGAGWTFVIWGVANALLLVINQVWYALRGPGRRSMPGQFVGWALTITGFTVAAVFFRAADLDAGWLLIKAMAGFGDAPLPVIRALDWDNWLIDQGVITDAMLRKWFGVHWTMLGTIITVLALAIALLVPDTLELTDYREADAQSNWRRRVGWLAWQPTLPWLALVLVLFIASFYSIGRVSEFFYYQF
jgi:D-alanyl-lipoteichoic acid acyltransferase DltB (MBOAT superfamily)